MPKKEQEPPRQMHLEQAHSQGYLGFWNMSSSVDPEKGINAMHNRYKRGKLRRQDSAYMLRQLKQWGFSDADKRIRIEINMKKAVMRLQKKGVWPLVLGKLTFQERDAIHEIVFTGNEPIRDLDSSEGVTIYPTEGSWFQDIYTAE